MTTDTDLLIPPHNIEAEETVLGSVLIDPVMFEECNLKPEEFYLVKHRWVWEAFAALITGGRDVDLFTVQEELEQRGQLKELGGPAYLTRLVQLTPQPYNASSYAALVRETAFRRALIRAASEIAKLAYDSGSDITTVAANAAAALDAMTPVTGINTDAFDAAHEWYAEVEARLTGPKTIIGLSTGYGALDEKTQGLKRGEVCVLAGASSMGKSSLAFQLTRRLCAHGSKIGIFSQEVPRTDVIERMALAAQNINSQKLTALDLPPLSRERDAIAMLPFTVNADSGLTVAEIARHARDMARAMRGIDLIVIDHLGYINHAGEKYDNLATRIGMTMKGLTRLAKQMNIAVLTLVQLNRDKNRSASIAPTLNDLRDSGNIEADARQVWALHRPAYYADPDSVDINVPQDAWVVILKNHRGPRNVTAKLTYIERSSQFSE